MLDAAQLRQCLSSFNTAGVTQVCQYHTPIHLHKIMIAIGIQGLVHELDTTTRDNLLAATTVVCKAGQDLAAKLLCLVIIGMCVHQFVHQLNHTKAHHASPKLMKAIDAAQHSATRYLYCQVPM